MNKEDRKIVKRLRKEIKRTPNFKFFVADKNRNGNDAGIGATRSVILGNIGHGWFQFAKVWGDDNEQRAINIKIEAL